MTLSNGIIRSIIGTILLLLIPLAGTILNPNSHLNGGSGGGSDWGPMDFLLMGALLFTGGLAFNLAAAKIRDPFFRGFAIAGIVFALFVLWVELAIDGVSRFLALVF
mgnify:CR=1 FL=1